MHPDIILLKTGKAYPGIGTVLALMFLPSDIYNKGWANGVLNTGLDAIPLFGTGKGISELFFGDFIPDIDEYDPEIYDAIRTLPTP